MLADVAAHSVAAGPGVVSPASKHSLRRPSPVGGTSSPMWAAEGGPCREADGAAEGKEKTAAAAGEGGGAERKFECDACPHCDDLCVWAACERCTEKEKAIRERNGGELFPPPAKARYTMCQVSKHTKASDVWLVAHGSVYDATEFLADHPGGPKSIMRHAGKDCSEDFDFHSSGAKTLWKDLYIGRLVTCPKDGGDQRCAIM